MGETGEFCSEETFVMLDEVSFVLALEDGDAQLFSWLNHEASVSVTKEQL